MSPLGAHLACEPGLSAPRQLLLRALGTPEPGLRTRTRHALRATLAAEPRFVVDAGCGAGFASIALALAAPRCRVVGVDGNGAQIERATKLAKGAGAGNATFVTGDVLAFEPQEEADVVLCLDALEYVADDSLLLARMRGWLRPGGRLVLHCRATPTPRVLRAFRHADPCFDGRVRPGYGPAELRLLLDGAGLTVVDLRQTLTPPAELAFELAEPSLGPLRNGALRLLALPFLLALARADAPRLGRGAGLLAVAVCA